MRIQLTGILETDPQPGAGGIATLMLAAEAQLFEVQVSSQHAQWVVSTFEGGQLVEAAQRPPDQYWVQEVNTRLAPCLATLDQVRALLGAAEDPGTEGDGDGETLPDTPLADWLVGVERLLAEVEVRGEQQDPDRPRKCRQKAAF